MKETVYIETSVVSYYTSRSSRDLIIAAHQQVTQDWWFNSLPRYEAFVSPLVLEESAQGDAQAAEKRLGIISAMPVLAVTPEVHDLANVYFSEIGMPREARADSYHLALAAWHSMDYLVTWNCAHIANARIIKVLEEVNAKRGIRTPVICTPEELMEV